MRKNYFTVCDQSLEVFTQRSCGISLTGDVQELSGCNPIAEHGPNDPLWSFPTCLILYIRMIHKNGPDSALTR